MVDRMSLVPQDRTLTRLLDEVASTVTSAPFCWLISVDAQGFPNARPMGPPTKDPRLQNWRLRFLADIRSEKVSDIRATSRVAVITQRADNAFVVLSGSALLVDRAEDVRRFWRPTYDQHFPTAEDRLHAAFLDVKVEQLKAWIRGLTPEPFGLRWLRASRDEAAWKLHET